MLHVHPNTLRRWSDQGKIRSYRITARGDRRFLRQDVARFIADLNSTPLDEKTTAQKYGARLPGAVPTKTGDTKVI